jgi:hypothetical protein
MLAEREGFEPPIALRLCLISSQVHSTGLCHLSDAPVPFENNVSFAGESRTLVFTRGTTGTLRTESAMEAGSHSPHAVTP